MSDKLSDVVDADNLRISHRLAKGILEDIETYQFNTAVSKLMIFANELTKLNVYSKQALKMALQCLYPFAPHLAYELWEKLGEKSELALMPFPKVEEKYLIEEVATYVVQVNGKLRGKFDLPKDQSQEDIIRLAKLNPNISKHLDKTIIKTIFVPNKLINFVVE